MAYLFQSGSMEAQLSGGMDFNYSNVETDKMMAINSDATSRAAAVGVFGLGADGSADGALYWNGSELVVAAATTDIFAVGANGVNLSQSGDYYSIQGTSVLNATTLGSAVVASSLTSLGTQGEALDMGDNNISNVGDIDCDSISVADAANGLDVIFGGDSGTNKMSLTDNLAIALDVTQGANSYLKFVTTDGSEQITFGKNSTFNGTTIADLGTVTTADINGGSLDGVTIGAASAGAGTFAALIGTSLSVSDGDITNVGVLEADTIQSDADASGLNINIDGNTGTNKITINDGLATGLLVEDSGGNDFMIFSTDGDDNIKFKKGTTFNGTTIADLGTVTTATSITSTDLIGTNIDGIIGADTARAGTFTSLDCTDGAFAVANLDIDGATDIGAALVDADLFIVDDGAGGTNRKSTLSRLKTYIGAGNEAVEVHGVHGNQLLSGGMNVATGSFAANRTWTLPRCSSISEGEIYRVKVTGLDGNTLTVAVNANDSIDDLAVDVDLELNSDNGSISLMCVDTDSAGKWKIF